MQAIVAQALRACSRTLPAKSPASRVALSVPGRAFLIAPSYKSRIAVAFRGYATATATKKPAAKKPAAKKGAATTTKKTTTKKAVAGKTAAKAKPKKAVKKAAAKPKPKPKPKKKELTPDEKASVEKRLLKKDSLAASQPTKLPYTSWMVYCSTESRGRPAGKDLGATVKAIAEEFKKLPPSEVQRLAEKASQNGIQNAVNFKKWVESYPVDVIKRANRARSKLDRIYKIRVSPIKIVDERNPKRPGSAFAMYIHAHSHEVTATGQNSGSKIKLLSEKWNSLGATEKKAFYDLAAAERVKYAQEATQLKA